MKARKVNPLITAINEQIKSYKRDAKALHEKATKLAKDRMMIRALHSPLFASLTKDDSVYIYTYAHTIQFNVYLRDLTSFKDERLTSMLSVAMETISDRVKETDFAQYDHKEYRVHGDSVSLEITAYVMSDSPTCKKVMTGMELKEVPQYKFVCE